MRPKLMLFVGTRGVRVADVCTPLAAFADVVLAVSDDVLAGRADRLDETVPHHDLIRVPHRDDLVAAALRHARRHPVDGALTFSDDMLVDTARFADAADLPGQPVASVEVFRDKFLQRKALAAGGLRVPRYAEITSPVQADAALTEVGLPAILKPTRGSGSALAFPVATADELRDRLREAFDARALVGGAVAADTAFILEELLVGDVSWQAEPGFAPYVSVETVAVDGEYRHLGVTDRFPLAPPVLETGMMFPSGLAPAQTARITAVATDALTALGFRHGLAHVELMLTAGGPVVIEVNARAGGALPYLVPLATGVDLVAVAGRAALGRLPDEDVVAARRAVFVAPQHPVGVEVLGVDGLADVEALPGVRAVIRLAAGAGRTDRFQDTMIAAVLGTCDTPAEAVRMWQDVMRTVRGRYATTGAGS
ncbi:ATP-grasp domain-containing protein [Micromonospora sp. DT31]|uniref:ATP-grasp domain-containing protein n=1 Tax=Micromonospora sp. DT31 TaxID=3393434 RepID=UPI003CEC7559